MRVTDERRLTDGTPGRRAVLAGMAVTLLPLPWADALAAEPLREAMAAVFGDVERVRVGRVALAAPLVAENGATVPVRIAVESPMTEADHVTDIHVFAPQNPRALAAVFALAPLAGRADVQARIRLARTQKVVAVARMSDGSLWSGAAEVRVTVGGCRT